MDSYFYKGFRLVLIIVLDLTSVSICYLKVNLVDKDEFFGCQEAREKDVSITDEMARSALGSLGLTGDAALRPIRALSGTPPHFSK